MASANRSYNPGLTITTLKRNWPVMGIYALILCLFIPTILFIVIMTNNAGADNVTRNIGDMFKVASGAGAVMAMGASFVAGIICFSHLYTMRAAQFYLSLPLKRVRIFGELSVAAAIMMMIPVLLCAAICGLVILFTGSLNLQTMSYLLMYIVRNAYYHLFFLSVASICAVVAGNFLAYTSFYVVINFLALFIVGSISNLFESSVYGMVATISLDMTQYAPIVYLTAMDYSIVVLIIYALIAAALFALSVWAYKARKAESAGDVVAIGALRPVFKYGFAACLALALTQLMGAIWFGFSDFYYSLPSLIGMTVVFGALGYVIGDMLIKRTVRIGARSLKGLGAFSLAAALVMTGMVLIPSNMARITPAAEDIRYSEVSYTSLGRTYIRQTQYLADEVEEYEAFIQDITAGVSSSAEGIENARRLNAYLADNRAVSQSYNGYGSGGNMGNVDIIFTLKNGSTVTRRYPVYHRDNAALAEIAVALNTPEQLTKRFIPPETLKPRIIGCSVSETYSDESAYNRGYDIRNLSTEQAAALYEAVKRDLANGDIGTFVPENRTPYIGILEFSGVYDDSRYVSKEFQINVCVWNESSATRAALEDMDIVLDSSLQIDYGDSGYFDYYSMWGVYQGVSYNMYYPDSVYVEYTE